MEGAAGPITLSPPVTVTVLLSRPTWPRSCARSRRSKVPSLLRSPLPPNRLPLRSLVTPDLPLVLQVVPPDMSPFLIRLAWPVIRISKLDLIPLPLCPIIKLAKSPITAMLLTLVGHLIFSRTVLERPVAPPGLTRLIANDPAPKPLTALLTDPLGDPSGVSNLGPVKKNPKCILHDLTEELTCSNVLLGRTPHRLALPSTLNLVEVIGSIQPRIPHRGRVTRVQAIVTEAESVAKTRTTFCRPYKSWSSLVTLTLRRLPLRRTPVGKPTQFLGPEIAIDK